MRTVLRIFFCLVAWAMFSPALAAAACQQPVEPACHAMPCCAGEDPCEMPDVPCVRCEPVAPPLALPALVPDLAPPLALIGFERPALLLLEMPVTGDGFIAIASHPPPQTLVALGTQLTC